MLQIHFFNGIFHLKKITPDAKELFKKIHFTFISPTFYFMIEAINNICSYFIKF